MSGASQHLTLFPERCDQCGACRAACPKNAIKVGASYLYVDWRTCDGCLACVEACDRNAIVSRVVPLRSSSTPATVPLAEVSKVVVGSRAEAKAVRKAAERAAKDKQSGKTAKHASPSSLKASPSASVPASVPAGARADQWAGGVALFDQDAPVTSALGAAEAGKRTVAAGRRPAEHTTPSAQPLSGALVEWTIVDAAAVIAISILALIIKEAVLGLPQVALMPALGKTAVRVVVLSGFYIAQIAAFGWLAERHGVPAIEAFGLGRPTEDRSIRPSTMASAGLVLLLLAGCELIAIVYGLAMRAAGVAGPARLSSDVAGVFGAGPLGLVFAVVLVVLAAPLAEEIAFRGILLPALGDRWGMWAGILGSAAIYAAFHLNWWLLVPTFALGVALGWLTWTRQSLWPALALHVLYNGLAVVAAFAFAK